MRDDVSKLKEWAIERLDHDGPYIRDRARATLAVFDQRDEAFREVEKLRRERDAVVALLQERGKKP
jgi:hypothetical protein